MQAVKFQDAAGIGRPPQNRAVVVEERKNPVTVGLEDALRAKVPADAYQAVGVGQLRIEKAAGKHTGRLKWE